MKEQKITRRNLLRTAVAGTTAIALSKSKRSSGGIFETVRIEEPFHGAVLNRRYGEELANGLKIRVSGRAPMRDRVTVNGKPTQRAGSRFSSDVVLKDKETEIVSVSQGNFGKHEHRVRVVWDRHSQPRYRFSIDDNSFFLRDIAQKNYKSLFDCFYLDILRKLHTKYGARFVLNIYYTTEDGFTLAQFPDRYKGEWQKNSNWLKLAFHAHSNEPARPYQYAPGPFMNAEFARLVVTFVSTTESGT
jgi:hypothetical protein